MAELLTLSATALAQRIRDGELTAAEAVETHIEQVDRVNPTLNAVVKKRYDEARQEAEHADRARAAGESLGPLHGVPCTIKECFGLEGMPNCAGLVTRRHHLAERDATCVARIRGAGAIPLGVTNTSELCMWIESNNFVYGRSNNPYDPGRIVGGSSGGEGAIIAAGGSPFGLGSDIGGSIRGPCFFNGIFGHKPTGGLVPGTGQFPIAAGDALRYLTSGPMVRKAEDLFPLLAVLAGPDGKDSGCRELELTPPSEIRLDGRKLLVIPDDGKTPIDPAMQAAQRRAADALADCGMVIEERRFDALERQFEIWSAMMHEAQDESFGSLLGEGKPIRPAWELLKLAFGRSNHTVMASLLALTDPVPAWFPGATRKAVALGARLKRELLEALGDDGVLLYPTYPTPAPRHTEPIHDAIRFRWHFAHTAIFNVLQFPVTQVPLGLDGRGIPVGVQVGAPEGADGTTIAVALELERALGGWVPPELAGLS